MVEFEKRGNIEIAKISVNKINALVSEEIRDDISRIFDKPNSKVIIDLSDVEYIDSSGFGCFLSIMKAARTNYGAMKISNPSKSVLPLFKTLHLHTIFEIYNDLEQCIDSFN